MGRAAPMLLALAGCTPVTTLGEGLVHLTDPIALHGLLLSVEPHPSLALPDAATLEVVDPTTGAPRPIDELRATVAGEPIPLLPEPPARFTLDGDSFPYEEGAPVVIEADLPGRVTPGSLALELPPPASFPLPTTLGPGETLTVDLRGQGYDAAALQVFGADGTSLFADRLATQLLTVPTDVLPSEGPVVIGVAGLRRATVEGGLDPISAVYAGRLQLGTITVGSPLQVRAVVLRTEEPPAAMVPFLAERGFVPGVAVDLWVETTDGTPVAGASAWFDDEPLDRVAGGHHHRHDLPLTLRQEVELRIEDDAGAVGRFSTTYPATSLPPLPPHPAQTALEVDVDGEAVWGFVVLGPHGATWSDLPDERWAEPSPPPPIPAEAFPQVGSYAVGVAIVADHSDRRTGLAASSRLLVGTLHFTTLQVIAP